MTARRASFSMQFTGRCFRIRLPVDPGILVFMQNTPIFTMCRVFSTYLPNETWKIKRFCPAAVFQKPVVGHILVYFYTKLRPCISSLSLHLEQYFLYQNLPWALNIDVLMRLRVCAARFARESARRAAGFPRVAATTAASAVTITLVVVLLDTRQARTRRQAFSIFF